MNKKFLGMLLTAMLVVTLCATALASGYVYISANCNVRKGPGTDYSRIGTAGSGSSLPFIGTGYDGNGKLWYSVSFEGQTGWVSAAYASRSDNSGKIYSDNGTGHSTDGGYTGSFEYGATVSINGNCNVRSGPSLSHSIIKTVYKGDALKGTGSISTDSRGVDWYSVRVDGKDGWVSSGYASLSGGGGSSSGGSSSGKVVATGGDSNVRSGPGLSYSNLGTLYKGNSATYLGDSSVDDRGVRWYKVSFNGKTGWVSSRYTTLNGSSSGGGGTSSGNKVVATGGDSNVRSGPGLSYSSLGTLYNGNSATYLYDSSVDDRGVRWYKVSFNGKTGWVSSRYTTLN